MELLSDLILIALIAALAQTVNQAMGMGYGVITSSLLLGTGMPPAVISATVHAAKIGTSSTGALAHWRLGNVDRRAAVGLALPGMVGGFSGALLLSSVPAEVSRPVVGTVLLVLGLVVLVRFVRPRRRPTQAPWRTIALAPLGAGAGLLDAAGGGGWGPVTMGTLMARPPAEPRIVVGTVNAGEAFATAGATIGFLLAQGLGGFHFAEVLALMAGGILVSVPAAALAQRLRPATLGIGIGMLLITINARTVAGALGADTTAVSLTTVAAAGLSLAMVGAIRTSASSRRVTRTTSREPAVRPVAVRPSRGD